MTYSDLVLDEVLEVSLVLLLHCFSGLLLGDFLVMGDYSNIGFGFGFVGSVGESPVDVSVWAAMAWASKTEVVKMVACKFSTALGGGFSLLFQ